jgi:SAM-dependent methyltransferase
MPDEAQGLMLNLGCGARTHRAFVNIDHSYVMLMKGLWFLKPFIKTPIPDSYLHHNLRKGIPFTDGSADVVYSSHVLEHLEPRESLLFMREIYRVLKVNGIIRIVVPDLEISAAAYLEALHRVRSDSGNNHENVDRHEWSTIYLLDQLVERPGGYMTQCCVAPQFAGSP